MKRTIKGKTYNTKTATEVATHSNRYGPADAGFESETLYERKKGGYFLHGEGGWNSKYASVARREPKPPGASSRYRSPEPSRGPGQKIIPLDEDGVKAWCNKTGKQDVAMKLFEVEEA